MVAVRWYLRYGLSYRDVEELLAERGVEVDHVTVFRWVQRFTPLLADAARFTRHSPGDRWFVDETSPVPSDQPWGDGFAVSDEPLTQRRRTEPSVIDGLMGDNRSSIRSSL